MHAASLTLVPKEMGLPAGGGWSVSAPKLVQLDEAMGGQHLVASFGFCAETGCWFASFCAEIAGWPTILCHGVSTVSLLKLVNGTTRVWWILSVRYQRWC